METLTGDIENWRNGDMEKSSYEQGDMAIRQHGKRKTEAQAIFLNPFTVYSSCKQSLSLVRLLRTK
jgi:hypothetical protein